MTQPFRIGDQIAARCYEGTVEDIQARATFIRTYDGRRVVVPNAVLFTDTVVVNTAFAHRRLEYDVGIGYLEVAANQLFPERLGHGDTDVAEEADPTVIVSAGTGDSRTVHATMAGYVQALDGERLMAVAREQGVSLRLHVRPGAFVSNGAVLMTVCASAFHDKWTDGPFRSVVIVGEERTGTQDIEFFINQLVELAVRALSPGINDPATARSCIDRLEQALCNLASRRFPSPIREDADHTPRVFACSVTFATLIDSAFSEIGRYGQTSVSVTCRLLEAVRNISACVTRDVERRPLAAQAAAIVERSRRAEMATCDRDRIEERYENARIALHDAKEPSRQGSSRLGSTPP